MGLYLLLTRVAIMVGDADFVEQAVQLANYCIDLLGQVTRVHFVGAVCESGQHRPAQIGSSSGLL